MKKAMYRIPYSYDLGTIDYGRPNRFESHPREWIKKGFYRAPYDNVARLHPRLDLYEDESKKARLIITEIGNTVNYMIINPKMVVDVHAFAYLLLEHDILDVKEVTFATDLNNKFEPIATISGNKLGIITRFRNQPIEKLFRSCENKTYEI